MKKKLVLLALGTLTLASCQTQPKEDYSWIKKGLDVASAQLELTAEEISSTNMLPRSIRTGYDMNFLCRQLERDSLTFKDSLRAQPTAEQLGKRRLCGVYDWTSGFFAPTRQPTKWENAVCVAFTIGPAVSIRVLYGMLTN